MIFAHPLNCLQPSLEVNRITVLVTEVCLIFAKYHLHLLIAYNKVQEKNEVHFQCSVSFSVVNFEARCWVKSWFMCTFPTLVSAFFSFLVARAQNTSLLWILCALCWGDVLWKVATRGMIRSCRGRRLSSRWSKKNIDTINLESQQWRFATFLCIQNVSIQEPFFN